MTGALRAGRESETVHKTTSDYTRRMVDECTQRGLGRRCRSLCPARRSPSPLMEGPTGSRLQEIQFMKLRTLAAVALATSAVSFAAPASAADKMMGLRLETAFVKDFNIARFGSGVTAGDSTFPGQVVPVGNVAGTSPNGDLKVGYDLPNGLTPLIGIGFRSESFKTFDSDDKKQSHFSATAIVLDAELRYYFKPHKKGLQPYVWGEFSTTIATVGAEGSDDAEKNLSADEKKNRDALLDAVADELNVTQLNVGFGAEYKFSKSFGIGGKWGLGLAFQGTEEHKGAGDFKAGSNSSNTTFGTSTALYAAWRL